MESIHVVSITFMLGAIVMVDLGILGLAAKVYPGRGMTSELVPWSAAAFAIACVTGVAMFITRASAHVINPAFQIKMLLLVIAGANIAIFHRRIIRMIPTWDSSDTTPPAARVVAFSSLFLWCGVMLAGRWVGHVI